MKKNILFCLMCIFLFVALGIASANAVELKNNNKTTNELNSLNEGSKFYGHICNSAPDTYHTGVKVELIQNGKTIYETISSEGQNNWDWDHGYFEINNYRVKLSKPGLVLDPTFIFGVGELVLEFPEDAGYHYYYMMKSLSRPKTINPIFNSFLEKLNIQFPLLQQLLQRLPAFQ